MVRRKPLPVLNVAPRSILLAFQTVVFLTSDPGILSAGFSTWGMAPEDVPYFQGRNAVFCRDGSRQIPTAVVNDNYCDCEDGTDEPGTSACPTSTFFCTNKGHTPQRLFSSRVNDGICDCCDGSDEYSGWVKCPNTCLEAGTEARRELRRRAEAYREGAKIRGEAVSRAQQQRQQWEAEAATLEAEMGQLETQERQLREVREEVEKKEREEKEWREKLEKEQKERERLEKEGRPRAPSPPPPPPPLQEEVHVEVEVEAATEAVTEDVAHDHADLAEPHAEEAASATNDADTQSMEEEEEAARLLAEAAHGSPDAGEGGTPAAEGVKETSPAEGVGGEEEMSGLSKEEIGRRIAERWTGGHRESAPDRTPSAGDVTPPLLDDHPPEHHEDHMAYPEDDVYDDEDLGIHVNHSPPPAPPAIDEDSEDDEGECSSGSQPSSIPAVSPRATWWARALQWPRDVCSRIYSLVASPPAPQVNRTEAERVKREHAAAKSKLSQARSKVDSLREKLNLDYGPDGQFIDLADKCFSFNVHQYEYKVCPYKEVTQLENHQSTTVGRWTGFDSDYTEMRFENGDHCWNGPSRSMRVSLQCGAVTEVLSVDEPSRCEYHALMSTPALCNPATAKELEEEVAKQEKEVAALHDEL